MQRVEKEIKFLLENKIIQECISKYCSQEFPLHKRNGIIRLVIDYRKLNDVTIKKNYIFPTIKEN